jgi:hypothetical protein
MAMSAELALLQRVCAVQSMQYIRSALYVLICMAVARRGVLVRVSLVMSQQRGLAAYDASIPCCNCINTFCDTT